jgi:transglutaminase-like putative cysteine protease
VSYGWGGAPDWVKELAKLKLPAYPADTPGVVLLDETGIEVTAAGEIRSRHRRAIRVLNTSGRNLGYAAIHFDDETRVSGFRAWSISAQGEEFQVKDRDSIETSAISGELYADHKVHVLRIPAADPGSVIAYEYEQRERPNALQSAWTFQQEIPVRSAVFRLSLPPGWSHEERWFNASAVQPQASDQSVIWQVMDVPAVKAEPRRPTLAAVAGRLSINFIPAQDGPTARSHRTWNDVAAWYTNIAAPRRLNTAVIAAKAKDLTAGAPTTMEKIRSLASFAQRDVRYVAIEIGIGGYQPHYAGEILEHRYGDCKDKVTLLATMLREIGVDAYYVIATTDRGVIDPQFASMNGFNHAVIAIRLPENTSEKPLSALVDHPRLGRLLIFDPTSEETPLGELPTYLQDNDVLIVRDQTGDLIHLSGQPPESSQLRRFAKMRLGSDGGLVGDVREMRTGAIAASVRTDLHELNERQRTQYLERTLAYHLSQFQISDLSIENLDDISKELIIRYKLSAPAYAKRVGGLTLVRPRILGQKPEMILDLKDRTYAYETEGASFQADDTEIAIGDGLTIDELPPAVNFATEAVSYSSEATYAPKALHYRREYRIRRFTVPRAQLDELNRAFSRILADEKASAVFRNAQ